MYRVEIHRTTTHKYVMRLNAPTRRDALREVRCLIADDDDNYLDLIPDDAWDYVATEGYRIYGVTREAV